MKLHRKALYNLLKYNYYEDPSSFEDIEPWQVEDLSLYATEELFQKLRELGYSLTNDQFISVVKNCDNPEEAASFWVKSDDEKDYDQLFLLVFELWKRLFSEKQTICIFCDELDHLIYLYDTGVLESDELLQDKLASLLQIFHEHMEAGVKQSEVFDLFSSYCAHDMEQFLYDYISDQIDAENSVYARELCEGFYPFMKKPIWFDFLQARISSLSDMTSANEQLLAIMQKAIPLRLGFDILLFLVKTGDRYLFFSLAKKILNTIKKEKDFQIFLKIVADFFHRLDQEELEKNVLRIMEKRSKQKHKPLDPDIAKLSSYMILMGEKSI